MENYENNIPQTEVKKKLIKPGPVAGIVVFVLTILLMLFVFSYAQYYLGMWGLLITEVGLALLSVVAALICGLDLKEMVPLKKIKVNQFFGTIMVWIGSFLFVMIINLIFFNFFPKGFGSAEELNEFLGQWPPIAALILVSVSPAICEELLTRGFIQKCFSIKVKNKWALTFIIGIIFGIFHLDVYRFLATAILGGVLAYILIETDNFFYNMLFHFCNNFFAQAVSILGGDTVNSVDTEALIEMLPLSTASYMIIGCVAPLFLFGGVLMIKGLNAIKQMKRSTLIIQIVVAVAIAAIIFVAGIVMFVVLLMQGGMPDMANITSV